MLQHATFSLRILEIAYLSVACGDSEDIWKRFSRMFSSHSLIQNALVNNDDALVNVIIFEFEICGKQES